MRLGQISAESWCGGGLRLAWGWGERAGGEGYGGGETSRRGRLGGVSVGGVAQKIPLRPGGGLEGNSAG